MEIPPPEPTLPSLILDDEPTERFALQRCPACQSLTQVALSQATATCETCGHVLDVAPLLA